MNEVFLEGLRDGNEKIILKVYELIFPKVKNFIFNNKGGQAESEDIFQEALYQLIVRLKSSEVIIHSSFEAYFFTICKNLWRKRLTSEKKWVRNDEFTTLESDNTDLVTKILSEERWELFEEKLNQLSENCKALLKDYFSKVSYDAIVKKFNYTSENVAFQRIFKCKKRFGDLIKRDARYQKLKS